MCSPSPSPIRSTVRHRHTPNHESPCDDLANAPPRMQTLVKAEHKRCFSLPLQLSTNEKCLRQGWGGLRRRMRCWVVVRGVFTGEGEGTQRVIMSDGTPLVSATKSQNGATNVTVPFLFLHALVHFWFVMLMFACTIV